MKVLGIDPGYHKLGIAIIEKKSNSPKEVLIYSDCFKTSANLPHEERLSLIKKEIERIIKEYEPEALAIETLFFNTNQKTAMKVSEARGVIISTCASNNLSVREFSPPQIKAAITGNGRSSKKDIIKMVPLLIVLNKAIKEDDEYDAIASGLTFFAINTSNF